MVHLEEVQGTRSYQKKPWKSSPTGCHIFPNSFSMITHRFVQSECCYCSLVPQARVEPSPNIPATCRDRPRQMVPQQANFGTSRLYNRTRSGLRDESSPVRQIRDVARAVCRDRFTQETLNAAAVRQANRANPKRRGNRFHERSELLRGQAPNLDEHPYAGPIGNPYKPGLGHPGSGQRKERII